MLKPLAIATVAVAVAGSSIVYAQERLSGPRGELADGGPRLAQWHRPSAADMAAFADARIAALKAGLQLTPDQAKNWPPFEQALRDRAQLRIEHMKEREAARQSDQAPATPFDRMAQRADHMAKLSAALKRIAETWAPLYQSLDEAQKNRFRMLARMLRPHPHMPALDRGNQPGWRQGYGYGRGDDEVGGWRGFRNEWLREDDQSPPRAVQKPMPTEYQDSEL